MLDTGKQFHRLNLIFPNNKTDTNYYKARQQKDHDQSCF